MSLKKIIGSHFANYYEAEQAANLIFNGKISPLIYDVTSIHNLSKMADLMYRNENYGKIVFLHD